MEMFTVSPKYQLVIPPYVRKKLGILPGSKATFIELDGNFVLFTPKDPKTMRGKFKGLDSDFTAERAQDRY